MKPHNRKISPLPTLKHTGIRLSKPANYAAGAQGTKKMASIVQDVHGQIQMTKDLY